MSGITHNVVMGKPTSIDEFMRILNSKKREIVFTAHALEMSSKRGLPRSSFEEDMSTQHPTVAVEQESEVACERKFDVYYLQEGRTFHRYVIALNNMMRVITLLRTNKDVQRKVADGKA